MTVQLDENDAALVCKLAAFEGVTISDFLRTAILEKIEDAYDLQELRKAVVQDTGDRYTLDEVAAELG